MRAGEIGKPDCNRSAREESAPILGKRAGKANSRPLHHVSVSTRISGVITSNDDPHEGERPYMSRLRNPVRTPYTACGYPNIGAKTNFRPEHICGAERHCGLLRRASSSELQLWEFDLSKG